MALSHNTELLSVSDAKVRPMLTDPAGGTATYGAWVDLPDVTTVSLEGDTDVKIRRGDGQIRSQRQVLTGLTLTVENTVVSLDLFAAIEGGVVTDSGTGGTAKWTYDYGKSAQPPYVQFSAQCTGTSYAGGDVHLDIYKCKLNNKIALGFTDDDFQTFSYEFGSVARSSDDKYYSIVGNTTLVAIDAP